MDKLIHDRKMLLKALSLAVKDDSLKNDMQVVQRIYDEITLDKLGHFVSLSQDDNNKISFANTTSFKFDNARRSRTSFGRYIRRQLKISENDLSDASLYQLSLIVAKHTRNVHELDDQIVILKGKEIVEYYRDTAPNYTHSCMTGANAKKVSLYEKNRGNISLVVTKRHTRALLWKCDDGAIVLDRAYPSGSKDVHLLRDWALSKGYLIRSNADQFVGSLNTVALNDNSTRYVTVIHENEFPFMDTFIYGDMPEGNTVTLCNDAHFGNKMFQDQHGGFIQSYNCSSCSHRFSGVPLVYKGKDFCKGCFDRAFYTCKLCSASEDATYKQQYSGYCKACFSRLEKCDHCGLVCEISHKKEGKSYCSSCVRKLYVVCKACKLICKVEDCVEHNPKSITEKYVCKSCYDKTETCEVCSKQFVRQNGYYFSGKWFCGDGAEDNESCYTSYEEFCCDDHSTYVCNDCSQPFLDKFHPRTTLSNKFNYCPSCAAKLNQ